MREMQIFTKRVLLQVTNHRSCFDYCICKLLWPNAISTWSVHAYNERCTRTYVYTCTAWTAAIRIGPHSLCAIQLYETEISQGSKTSSQVLLARIWCFCSTGYRKFKNREALYSQYDLHPQMTSPAHYAASVQSLRQWKKHLLPLCLLLA